jgi:hypothetical protein
VRLRRQSEARPIQRLPRVAVEQCRPGTLRWELPLYEASEGDEIEPQAVERVHGRQENAAGFSKQYGGGVELPFESGGEVVERLWAASKRLISGRDVAQIASEGVDLDIDAGQLP